MGRMDGKIALVTGAARGIGAAIAGSFVREGADVRLTDIEQDAGERLAAELGVRATFTRLDVREEADWSRVMASVVAAFGRRRLKKGHIAKVCRDLEPVKDVKGGTGVTDKSKPISDKTGGTGRH